MTKDGTKPQSDFADLTDFQRDILVVLAGLDGETGLSIKEELESYYEESVHHGRLYPNLDTLADEGLVDKFSIDNRSNGYRLTEQGSALLQTRVRWQREKLASIEGGEDSTNKNDTSLDPGGSGTDDSPGDPDQSDIPVEDFPGGAAISDLPIDEPSDRQVLLRVTERHETGEFKEQELTVVDTARESAQLIVWAKHDVQSGLESEDWFVMSGARLSQWERKGELVRSISSIEDTTLQKLDWDSSEDTLSEGADPQEDQDQQSIPKTDEEDLLSEIHEEFDLDI